MNIKICIVCHEPYTHGQYSLHKCGRSIDPKDVRIAELEKWQAEALILLEKHKKSLWFLHQEDSVEYSDTEKLIKEVKK